MTIASILHGFEWQKLRLTKSELQRMLLAGTAWGSAMTIGITGMTWQNCGLICLDHVAMTSLISITAGIIAIGPLAAYGRR
jgi:hypothetical protein